MKVLLTKDVAELGQAGNIYSVAGGYARNYLMPRGLAILATKGALKQAEDIKQAGIRLRARERSNAEAQAQMIKGQRLLFNANAGENDRLYGSVTSSDIAEKLSAVVGFEVDRRKLQLDYPLRDLGIYDLSVRLMPEIAATFKVAVVREGEDWKAADDRVSAKTAADKAQRESEAAATAAVTV